MSLFDLTSKWCVFLNFGCFRALIMLAPLLLFIIHGSFLKLSTLSLPIYALDLLGFCFKNWYQNVLGLLD